MVAQSAKNRPIWSHCLSDRWIPFKQKARLFLLLKFCLKNNLDFYLRGKLSGKPVTPLLKISTLRPYSSSTSSSLLSLWLRCSSFPFRCSQELFQNRAVHNFYQEHVPNWKVYGFVNYLQILNVNFHINWEIPSISFKCLYLKRKKFYGMEALCQLLYFPSRNRSNSNLVEGDEQA